MTRLILPDLYDPPHELEEATPFPLYHVEGTGTFAAVNGVVMHASTGARHLEGKRVREVLEECLEMEAKVLAVEPKTKKWKTWAGPLW